MNFKKIFILFILVCVAVTGVSAEENPETSVILGELNLKYLFGDIVNHVMFILTEINIEPFYGSSFVVLSSIDSEELEKEFNNGENVANLTNITSMNDTEIDIYVLNIASSRGYELVSSIDDTQNKFQIWYAINDTNTPEKEMHIIMQKKTGQIVIYNPD